MDRMTKEELDRLAEYTKECCGSKTEIVHCESFGCENINRLLSELAAVTRELEEANRVLAMYRIARSRQTLSDNTKMENQ